MLRPAGLRLLRSGRLGAAAGGLPHVAQDGLLVRATFDNAHGEASTTPVTLTVTRK